MDEESGSSLRDHCQVCEYDWFSLLLQKSGIPGHSRVCRRSQSLLVFSFLNFLNASYVYIKLLNTSEGCVKE